MSRREISVARQHPFATFASLTEIRHSLSSRLANDRVKPSGMCWVIRTPGLSAEAAQKILDRFGTAGGGPMMISFSLLTKALRTAASGTPPPCT